MSKSIFISYSHKDIDAVSKIAEAIEARVDCKLWFDKKLHGGDEYFSIIAENILACEYFLFVVSPNSVMSNWCVHELEFAMSEQRKIIAVWLEEFSPPPRIRLVISNTHYIRNYELSDDGLAKTVADALSAEHFEISRGEAEYKISEQQAESGKYFIFPEDTAKIAKLLSCEQKQDFITCFEAENSVLLGLAYEVGVGVPCDKIKADFYYHIAAYKGSMDGEYLMLALGLENNSVNKTQTVARMNELAEAGCVKAMVYWGNELYLGNWNMAQDKATAYRWFRRAADAGDPVAKYYLGFGYRTAEIDETPDYIIAWMYFHEAAQQNFPRAYRQIAIMYKKGQLVEQNLDTAREYYMKAVDNGDILSYNYIGNLEYDAKNYELAAEYYKKAADYVDKKSLPNGIPFYNLGWAYEFGQGCEKSAEKAIECYFKGAEKNHKSCKARLAGAIYDYISDNGRKEELLKKAKELNCSRAELFLGYFYSNNGNETEALRYYEMGADKGCLESMECLASIYSWVFGAKQFADREKSINNFRLYFSMLDHPDNKQFLEKRQKTFQLQQYYYVYAVELDTDYVNQKPDYALAMHYFKKCLECEQNYRHWVKILITAETYLKDTGSGITAEGVIHALELTELCDSFFDEVYEKSKKEGTESEKRKALISIYEMLLTRINSFSAIPSKKEKLNHIKSRIAELELFGN